MKTVKLALIIIICIAFTSCGKSSSNSNAAEDIDKTEHIKTESTTTQSPEVDDMNESLSPTEIESSENETPTPEPTIEIVEIFTPTPVPTKPGTDKEPVNTNTPTVEPSSTDAATPTKEATNTEAPTNRPTNTVLPSNTSTPAPTATNSPKPTTTNSPVPTATNSPVPTAAITKVPTATPTKVPTKVPTVTPTKVPTKAPTATPTKVPSKAPTKAPTVTPTPKIVKFIIVVDDVVDTQVSTGDAAIDLWHFEHDTAPNYPYITSHTPLTAENVKADLASGKLSMLSIFISACRKIGESYTHISAWKIGEKEETIDAVMVDYYGPNSPFNTVFYYDEFGQLCGKNINKVKALIYDNGKIEYVN